jgi:tetratricopeptide (TPR) repeat protein
MMSEGVPKFCSQCGGQLPAAARFCPGCGRALDADPAAAPPRSWREQLPGLVVLGVFLAVGLGVWVSVLQSSTSSASAVAAPTARTAPGAGGAGNAELPPDHPPIALPDEAKQFLAQLSTKAEAAPSDVGAWKTLAQVQARAAEVDPSYGSQAAESYRHVLNLAPDDADAVRGLANAYYDQQAYADAAKQYERYLELKPDDPNVLTDLGTAYLYQQQVDRAVETYQKVIEAHPDFLQAHFNLGLAYEAKGDREQALAAIAKARDLAKDDGTRQRIDRVVAQITGASAPAAAGGAPGVGGARAAGGAPGAGAVAAAGGAAPPGAGGMGMGRPPVGGAPAAEAAAPAGTDYRSEIEAVLRAHQILGRKITKIEWPDDTRARVLLDNFPMQAMPESMRTLFHGRLETIIYDAKEKYGVSGERTIDLVDAASGATMETVTQ